MTPDPGTLHSVTIKDAYGTTWEWIAVDPFDATAVYDLLGPPAVFTVRAKDPVRHGGTAILAAPEARP